MLTRFSKLLLCIVELPTPECFAFSINCMLCDIISLSEDIAIQQNVSFFDMFKSDSLFSTTEW